METGISLYPGLDNTAGENSQLLKDAARCGIRHVFTSLHIPETDPAILKSELSNLLTQARRLDMEIISDVSPGTLSLLGVDELSPNALLQLGITTARFDFGYGADTIACFSHAMRVQLNASTLSPRQLQELQEAETDFSQVDSLHNFYPRPHTGLSEAFFLSRTRLLQKAGITVGAFIPSQHRRRSPLKQGLPTLEKHRTMDVSLTGRHLAALDIDTVFIGDSLPSPQELQELSHLSGHCVTLRIRLLTDDTYIRSLLSRTFTARPDAAQDGIRAQESRLFTKDHPIEPDSTTSLSKKTGDITLDNTCYGRYAGELQIIRIPQEPCTGTNTVAFIVPTDLFLIKYITPGKMFRFEPIQD